MMASFATTCRLSARLTSRNVRRKVQLKDFSSSSPRWAAHNFVMPAMSPTMTEGNIASWKVKEGDSFSTGDVLLEIETDKAQMDVEAQDDGLVAKIMKQDGSKSVKVGTRIAVLADPDDDLKTIEIPAEDPLDNSAASKEVSGSSSESSKQEESGREAKESQKQAESSSDSRKQTSAPSSHQPSNQSYPLYPSVQHLLHTNGMSTEDASKITATGPAGRLLKGDVLAYLGSIDKSYAAEQSKRLDKLSHLDLSNIKIAPPKPAAEKDAKKDVSAKTMEEEVELATEVAVPISLAAVFATQRRMQDSLGITLPLSTFIARASEIANENLPRAKGAGSSSDELFDAVLGLDSVHERGSRGRYVPQIVAMPAPSETGEMFGPMAAARGKPMDIIDILTGKKAKGSPPVELAGAIGVASGAAGANNLFSVSVGKGEERRARVYLERVKSVLEAEPGRCVL